MGPVHSVLADHSGGLPIGLPNAGAVFIARQPGGALNERATCSQGLIGLPMAWYFPRTLPCMGPVHSVLADHSEGLPIK
jgi:hypothetical protein